MAQVPCPLCVVYIFLEKVTMAEIFNFILLVIFGLIMGLQWFDGKSAIHWVGRILSGVFLGTVLVLFFQLLGSLPGILGHQPWSMGLDRMVVYVLSVTCGSLIARRRRS